MTTFHDPQPLSRRAARQSQRDESFEAESEAESVSGVVSPPALIEPMMRTNSPLNAPANPPATATASPTSDTMWDTLARRAAQLPRTTPESDGAGGAWSERQPHAGRRAASAPGSTPSAEPLSYSTVGAVPTQVSPPAPSASPGIVAAAPVAAAPPVESAQPAPAFAEQQSPDYRPRDFSPESRRSRREAGQQHEAEQQHEAGQQHEAAQPYEVPSTHSVAPFPGSVAKAARVLAPVASPAPMSPSWPVPSSAAPIEQTLTRRELRALQAAEQHGLVEQHGVGEELGMVEAAWPAVDSPALFMPTPDQADAGSTYQPTSYSPASQPNEPVPTNEPAPRYAPASPSAAYEPAPAADIVQAITNEPAATAATAATHGESSEPGTWTAPRGHWSNQLDADDDDFGAIETTINRTVGGTSASTSALVLPAIPMGSDIRGALTHTGEVILTGSIDLPLSFSTTGATSRIDHGGIDDLFESNDEQIVSADSAPVSAVRAVSTNSGGHTVTHTQKPRGTRGLTALLITACSLAVVVTALIIAAFALNLF